MTDEKTVDDTDDLDALFEGDEETEDVEVDVSKDTKTDETEVDSDTKGETTESPSEEKPTLVPLAALKDERRKRQQLKEENENLRSQLPQTDEEPDVLDDPDAWKAYQLQKMQKEALDVQQAELNERVEKARSIALEKYPDYEEKEKVFMVLSALDLELSEKISADPKGSADFAYETANAYLESLKPSQQEKVLEEAEEVSEITQKKVPSLATATASQTNSVQVEKDDDDDMFEDQAY